MEDDSSISEFKWSTEWSDFDSMEPVSSFEEDDSLYSENIEDMMESVIVSAKSLDEPEQIDISKENTLSEDQTYEITDGPLLNNKLHIHVSESSGNGVAGEYLSPRDTLKKKDTIDTENSIYHEVSISDSQTRRDVKRQSQVNSKTFEEIQVDTIKQEQKPNALVLNKALVKTNTREENMKSDANIAINRNLENTNDWKAKWTSGIKYRAWIPSGLLDKLTSVNKVNGTQKNLQTVSRSNKPSSENVAQDSNESRQNVFSSFQSRRNSIKNVNANETSKDSQEQTVSATSKRIENKSANTRENQVAHRNSISSASVNIVQGGNRRGRTFDRRNTGSVHRVFNSGTRFPTNNIVRARFPPNQSGFTSRNAHHRRPQTSMRSRNAANVPVHLMNTNRVQNGAGANIGRQQPHRNDVRGRPLSSWNMQELHDFIQRFASKNTVNNISKQMRSVVAEFNRRLSNNRRQKTINRSNMGSLSPRNYRQQSIGLKRLTPGTVFTGGPLYKKIILRQRTPPYRLIERYVPISRTCKY